MSSFKHPVGSQPSRVYWRRRALAGVALVLIIIVVIALVAAHAGSGSAAPAPTDTSSAAPSPRATPTVAVPSAAATGTPTGTPTATPSSGAAGSGSSASGASGSSGSSASSSDASAAAGPCTASQITLKPIADRSSYTSLEQPKISMSITNSSSSACSIDLGSSQQVLTITSGTETYWSSKDCQVGGTHQVIRMTAGQTLTTPAITWDRTRSSTTTCNSTRSSVPAGGASYHLSVSVGAITSSTTALMILN